MYGGFDFGTSGARAIVVDDRGGVQFEAKTTYTIQEEATWPSALWELIARMPPELRRGLQRIGIDGTSGTFVGCDGDGHVKTAVQMYNDPVDQSALAFLEEICPNAVVLSSLARLISLQQEGQWQPDWHLVHHCDRVAYYLHRRQGITDWHNALKLGFDPIGLAYPDSILDLGLQLPVVVAPGTIVAPIHPLVAEELGINPGCNICSGTTDSNGAFLAAVGPDFNLGTAVTSLGSTLTLKILSGRPIFNNNYGIYSHRWTIADRTYWLAGGASNTGGAVLAHFFSPQEISRLSLEIDPHSPTNLDYYPLLKPGERFPIADPNLPPVLTPRPEQDVLFLKGLLEAMARIEHQGYDRLEELGADPITALYTVGGGAQNPAWTAIRHRYLQIPQAVPLHTEAAYGTALLVSNFGGTPKQIFARNSQGI